MDNENNRLPWVDMAKGIAIILVVCGHYDGVPYSLNAWLSWFHLPVFFVLAGFLMARSGKRTGDENTGTVIKGYLRGLMIPYLWFSAGALCIDCLKCFLGRMEFAFAKEHLIQTVTLQGYSVLWFLPTLCLAKITVFLLTKKWKPLIAAIVLSVAAIGLFYGLRLIPYMEVVTPFLTFIGKSVFGGAFAAFGMLFEKRLGEENEKFYVQALIGWAVLACVAVLGKCFGIQNMNNLEISFVSLYLVGGTFGSLALLFICKSLSKLKVLCFFGKNSLIIMCTHLHFYIMYLAIKLLELIPVVSGLPYVELIAVVVLTLVFEIPVIYIVNRFFPFVLGKRKV